MPTAQGEKVIMVEPGASVRGEVRHTVAGRVEGIDRNAGQITVKATNGATIREGDDVSRIVVVRPRP